MSSREGCVSSFQRLLGEVQGGHLHPAAEGVLRIGVAGQCPHADALVKQTPGDVPARIAEGAGDDGEVGVRQPRTAGAAQFPDGAASALRLSVHSPSAAGATQGSSKGHTRDSRYPPARSHPPAQSRIIGKRSRARLPAPS